MARDVVAKVFIFWQGKVLLIRRSGTDDILPGGWEIPGGTVETAQNETIPDGCIREAYEETGLQLESSRLREVVGLDDLQESRVERHVYTTELLAAQEPAVRLSHEHTACQWQPVSSVPGLLGLRFYSAAFERCQQGMN